MTLRSVLPVMTILAGLAFASCDDDGGAAPFPPVATFERQTPVAGESEDSAFRELLTGVARGGGTPVPIIAVRTHEFRDVGGPEIARELARWRPLVASDDYEMTYRVALPLGSNPLEPRRVIASVDGPDEDFEVLEEPVVGTYQPPTIFSGTVEERRIGVFNVTLATSRGNVDAWFYTGEETNEGSPVLAHVEGFTEERVVAFIESLTLHD